MKANAELERLRDQRCRKKIQMVVKKDGGKRERQREREFEESRHEEREGNSDKERTDNVTSERDKDRHIEKEGETREAWRVRRGEETG